MAAIGALVIGALAAGGCREINEPPVGEIPPEIGPITWERTSSLADEPVRALRSDNAGSLYAGTDSGRLYRTFTEGADWYRLALPYDDGSVVSIVIDPGRAVFVGIDIHGIAFSADAGTSWHPMNDGIDDTLINAMVAAGNGDLLAGSERGNLYSFTTADPVWRRRFTLGRPVVSLRVTSAGAMFAGVYTAGVYGFNPSYSSIEPYNAGLAELSVTTVYSTGTEWLYAGTRSSGLFRSDPNPVFWGGVGTDDLDRRINVLRIVPGGDLLAGTGAGVYLSDDEGSEWVRAGLQGIGVYSLEVNTDGIIFAGTSDGVYRGERSAGGAGISIPGRPGRPGRMDRTGSSGPGGWTDAAAER